MSDRASRNRRSLHDAIALRSARLLCVVAGVAFAGVSVLVLYASFREHAWLHYMIFATMLGSITSSFVWAMRRNLAAVRSLLEQDIERRERAEAALRETERHAANLLATVPDILLRVRRDGIVFDVSNDRGHALGQTVHTLYNSHLSDLAEPAMAGELAEALEKAFSSPGVSSASCTVRGTHGKQYAEIRAIATSSDEALVVVRDVTQEKAFEERLRTSDRLVALGSLSAGLAHEINNPLSYVSGNITYAIEEIETRQTDLRAALTALREARDGAERIGNIVAGLKQFTEAEDDKLGPVNINETVRSALRMTKAQLSTGTEVELELSEVPTVSANSTRLLQVVLNLLGNALQAFPDRSKEHNLIRIRTLRGGPLGVLLEVEDNGCGVPPALAPRIFEPFFSTRPSGMGIGLGLYLCRRFIHSFGGTITLDEARTTGALFRIALNPALEEPAREPTRESRGIVAMRVLIVDDEPLVARSVARMLKNCASIIASSGPEALSLCKDHDFDMILCDMMMPGMNGPEFFEALRGVRPELVSQIVFMTGGAFTDQATSFLARHGNPWLQKPVRREWLLDAAQQLRQQSIRLQRAQAVQRARSG